MNTETAMKINWQFNSDENRLNFSINKSFENLTIVLKERTSNLTCFYWKNANIAEGVGYFIIPTQNIKLINTDFTGFVMKLYENGKNIYNQEMTVIDKFAPKYFYSDSNTDFNIHDCFYVQYLDFYNNSFLNNIVKENDIIFDIGASCGTFAQYCLTRNVKKVVCLEPSPSFEILDKTFDGRVERYNMALGTENTYKPFYFTENTTLNSFNINDQIKYDSMKLIGSVNEVSIKCITLSELIKLSNIKKINLLKMDIEGYEYDIFKSISPDVLNSIDQLLIEFHHNHNHKTQIIVDKLSQCGFKLKYFNLNFESYYSLKDLKGVIYGRK